MEPVLATFLNLLEWLHDECKRTITGLTPAQLDWRPGPEMNSLAVLAAHTAGAETFWITEVVMGEPTGRVRAEEFVTAELSAEMLAGRLDAALERTRRAFSRLTTDQLAESRISPRDGREFTVAWCIAHVLEHTATHLGHMQITRQLLEADQV